VGWPKSQVASVSKTGPWFPTRCGRIPPLVSPWQFAIGFAVYSQAVSATDDSRAWKLVAPHCDIEERVRCVPPSAQVRGLWYKAMLGVLRQSDKLEEYREYFPDDRWSMLSYYPLTSYMLRVAVAGAIISSPSELHQGMHHAMRLNSTTFASTILGRALFRILAKDPIRLTEQAMAARRQAMSYGEWSIVSRGPRHIETLYRGEYLWIESAIAGAAVGTFDACNLVATVETRLDDRFNGSTLITW